MESLQRRTAEEVARQLRSGRLSAPPPPLNEGAGALADEEGSAVDVDDEDLSQRVNKKTGEIGGPRGPEPTRYSDWEVKGRCSDF
eukprot:jgi/Chlat1/3868/Chrsp26S04161